MLWKKTRDYILGTSLGVVFCVTVGKLWLVPDMTVWEIIKLILKSQLWW